MLELKTITDSTITVERNVENPVAGVAIVACQVVPDRGLAEKSLHWRLKGAIPPPVDISLGVDDARLRRIKLTFAEGTFSVSEEKLPAIAKARRGVPSFMRQMWKSKEHMATFADQFVDHNGIMRVSWTTSDDLWVALNLSTSVPYMKCLLDHHLSMLLDDRAALAGVLIRGFSDAEKQKLQQAHVKG